jgi:hypothetical protein
MSHDYSFYVDAQLPFFAILGSGATFDVDNRLPEVKGQCRNRENRQPG